MIRNYLIAILACSFIACAGPKPQPPVAPTPPVVKVDPKRTDLPSGFVEIKGDKWSYGLPTGFVEDKERESVEDGSLRFDASEEKHLGIQFAKEEVEPGTSVEDYVTAVIPQLVVAGLRPTALRENTKGKYPIALLVAEGEDVAVMFFIQITKDNIAYTLTCGGTIDAMKANSVTCFDVAKTLKVE